MRPLSGWSRLEGQSSCTFSAGYTSHTHTLDMPLRFLKNVLCAYRWGPWHWPTYPIKTSVCVCVTVQEGLAHGRWSRRRMQKLVVPQGFWCPGMQPECSEYSIFHDIFICSGSAHSMHREFLPGSHLAEEGSAQPRAPRDPWQMGCGDC